jgi:DNA repair photolyase
MGVEYREEPCRSAINKVKGMSFKWSLNPYTGCVHRCTFCFVRAFELRADRPFDDRYGKSIRVKTNLVEVLRRELAKPRWKHEQVVIGTATDPYQPAEGRYRLTRGSIAALAEARNPLSIITRGPMIVRDVDVLVEADRRASATVTFSVPTLDPDIWRKTEPGTAPPRQRLRALTRLIDAGIEASVGMAPILPGLSDRPELMADVVKAARDAGAASLWTNVLYLRPGTREHFLDNLARDWPEMLPVYERLYASRAYLGKPDVGPVRQEVAELRHRFGIADRRRVRNLPIPPDEPAVDAIQLELALAEATAAARGRASADEARRAS